MAGRGFEEILRRREARAALQAALYARHGLPLISITLVVPGPEKDSAELRALMDRAETKLFRILALRGASCAERIRYDGRTGSELLLAIEGLRAEDLKDAAMELENGRPWGRLLDADVLAPAPGGRPGGALGGRLGADPCAHPSAGPSESLRPLSRADRGLPARPCLACARSATDCIKQGRHSPEELAKTVSALLSSVRDSEPPR